jgi:hypothetical protein
MIIFRIVYRDNLCYVIVINVHRSRIIIPIYPM